jgi:phage terminase large subunit-like protein
MSAFAERLAEALSGDSWELQARPNQLLPIGDWSIFVLMAGRGWGKTRLLAETANAWSRIYQRQAIVCATAADARDVMIEGESGILATHPLGSGPLMRAPAAGSPGRMEQWRLPIAPRSPIGCGVRNTAQHYATSWPVGGSPKPGISCNLD